MDGVVCAYLCTLLLLYLYKDIERIPYFYGWQKLPGGARNVAIDFNNDVCCSVVLSDIIYLIINRAAYHVKISAHLLDIWGKLLDGILTGSPN